MICATDRTRRPRFTEHHPIWASCLIIWSEGPWDDTYSPQTITCCHGRAWKSSPNPNDGCETCRWGLCRVSLLFELAAFYRLDVKIPPRLEAIHAEVQADRDRARLEGSPGTVW